MITINTKGTEAIKKLVDKKYPNRLWGYIEEKGKVLFRVGSETKEFTSLNKLKDYLKK